MINPILAERSAQAFRAQTRALLKFNFVMVLAFAASAPLISAEVWLKPIAALSIVGLAGLAWRGLRSARGSRRG